MITGPGESEPSQVRGDAPAGPRSISAANAAPGRLKPFLINSIPAAPNQPANPVTFDRAELNRLFGLYGRKVAAGEWRDYAIDFFKDRAVFSVFRRSSEMPLYRIEKNPRLARRQGAYSVISATGLIVRRGHELERVLRAIDRSLAVVAS
ncbi:MAG TPA: DUF2794 domain-containing protein [Xanthobacteraceae bacterium]|nr:DUF2794 domain-containing protein [Xanthobacteraceae bacterium]